MTDDPKPTLEQFRGCLLGLAVGDGLGSPWEGCPGILIYDMGPADEIVRHADEEPLYYTDDTQMAIGVVETLLELGHIEVEVLAHRFAQNYHPDRGYGQFAREVINAIGFGDDWNAVAQEAFGGEGSLGNGGAMRVAPLGVFFSDNLETAASEAGLSALPTHRHPIGIDGARLIAVAAALAARGAAQPFDRGDFLSRLCSFADTEEFQYQLRHAMAIEPFQSLQAFGNSLEAHRSVVTSIVCFADSPDDYPQAIGRAIGQGDDVDTLAAMTGALAGARLGIDGIPQGLIDCLEDGDKGRAYLLRIAEQLWKRCCDRGSPKNILGASGKKL